MLEALTFGLTEKGWETYEKLRTAVGEEYPVLPSVDVFVLAVAFWQPVTFDFLLPVPGQVASDSITPERLRASLNRLYEAGLIAAY